jgi:hypothetical protein
MIDYCLLRRLPLLRPLLVSRRGRDEAREKETPPGSFRSDCQWD